MALPGVKGLSIADIIVGQSVVCLRSLTMMNKHVDGLSIGQSNVKLFDIKRNILGNNEMMNAICATCNCAGTGHEKVLV